MNALVLHVAAKDVRQLRVWLGAFFAVVVLRAALMTASFGMHAGGESLAVAADSADLALALLHLGLLVAVGVQLVQVDRLVGTTAFWVSRPVPRLTLLSAKLLTAVVCLVLIPCLLDAVVLAFSPATWTEVLGAACEGTFVRLALVVPVMALAAVTADLAVFVLSGVAALLGTLMLVAGLTALKLLPWRSVPAVDTAIAVGAALTLVISLAALAHQTVTRRTGRTVGLIVISGLVILHIANRLDWPFLQPPLGLEAGSLDTARVTVAMTSMPPAETPSPADGHSWLVRATCALGGAPPNVRLVPLAVESVATFPDGTTSRLEASAGTRAWGAIPYGRLILSPTVQSAIGGARLIGAESGPEKPVVRPIASFSRQEFDKFAKGGTRFDTRVTVGGLAYRVLAVLPVDSPHTADTVDRRVSVRPLECTPERCGVEVVEAKPAFAMDLRRPSAVIWLLVNRSRHEAFVPSPFLDVNRFTIFGRLMFPLMGQHLSVETVRLWTDFARDASGPIDAAWMRDASVAVIEVRDIGSFTVRAKVEAPPRAGN